jgi:hypothetical protein
MLRRQFINTIRRYSHNKCEKNISQINCNEKKIDLIQKQLLENNEHISKLHDKVDMVFLYSLFSSIMLFYKSV